MMARVRGVILSAIWPTFMFQVAASLSTRTGRAPAGTSALLDLDHYQLLQDFEAMATGRQQDHIAGTQQSAVQVLLPRVVEIDAQAAALDEQHFLGVVDFARRRIVDVRRDRLADRVA